MSMQDPIADMLTRLRNAGQAGLAQVEIPLSRMKESIAKVLLEEGYIQSFAVTGEGVHKQIAITLKYADGKPVIEGLERVSKPSCRTYCGCCDIPRVRNGLGTVILSTPRGVVSGSKAKQENVGGEVLCYIW